MLKKIMYTYSIILLIIFILNVFFLNNVLYEFLIYATIYIIYYKHRSEIEKVIYKIATSDTKMKLFCIIYMLVLFMNLMGIMMGAQSWLEILSMVNEHLNTKWFIATKWLVFINIIAVTSLITIIVSKITNIPQKVKYFVISTEISVCLIIFFLWEYIYKVSVMNHIKVNLVVLTILICMLIYSFETLMIALREELIKDLNKPEYKELVQELTYLASVINNSGVGTIEKKEFPWHLKYMLKTELICVKDYIDKENIDKYSELNYKMSIELIEALNQINNNES